MKTAKAWCSICPTILGAHLELIQQIQLDAIKKGMTRAAEICTNEEEMQPLTNSERNTGIACATAILSIRDNLKKLWAKYQLQLIVDPALGSLTLTNNTMTKLQRKIAKQGNARRRDEILKRSYKVKLVDGNLCVNLGGVGQKSKYSKLWC